MLSTHKSKFASNLVAHRGASSHAPENTLAAFELARVQGARWIEFDVSLLGDGTPVILHDDNTQRCSNKNSPIESLSLKDLATIDAGSWFDKRYAKEKIPQLIDLLNWMRANTIYANIELKRHPHQTNTEAFIKPILTILKQYQDLWERCLITSFDGDCLDYCQRETPQLSLGVLYVKPPENWLLRMKQLAAKTLHIHYEQLTPELLATAAAHNILVRCYTPKDTTIIDQWQALGLGGVIVNDPKLFLEYITGH